MSLQDLSIQNSELKALELIVKKRKLLSHQFIRLLSYQNKAMINRNVPNLKRLEPMLNQVQEKLVSYTEQGNSLLQKHGYPKTTSTFLNEYMLEEMVAPLFKENQFYQERLNQCKKLCTSNQIILDKQSELCSNFMKSLSKRNESAIHYDSKGTPKSSPSQNNSSLKHI